MIQLFEAVLGNIVLTIYPFNYASQFKFCNVALEPYKSHLFAFLIKFIKNYVQFTKNLW